MVAATVGVGVGADGGVRNPVSSPTIRHSGRSSLPICGEAVISATISGSSSATRNWPERAAALKGTSRHSQAYPRGNSERGTAPRAVPRRPPQPCPTRNRPAWIAATSASTRRSIRRRWFQTSKINAAGRAFPALRAATTWHSASITREKRSVAEREGDKCMDIKKHKQRTNRIRSLPYAPVPPDVRSLRSALGEQWVIEIGARRLQRGDATEPRIGACFGGGWWLTHAVFSCGRRIFSGFALC